MIIDGIPLTIYKNSKRWQAINLNSHCQNRYFSNKKNEKIFRKMFKELISDIDGLPPDPPFKFVYTIYRRNSDKVDLMNVGAAIDKFVSDCLVCFRLIPDDNTDFIKEVDFKDGGIDRINPRAKLEIIHCEKIKKGDSEMSLTKEQVFATEARFVKEHIRLLKRDCINSFGVDDGKVDKFLEIEDLMDQLIDSVEDGG